MPQTFVSWLRNYACTAALLAVSACAPYSNAQQRVIVVPHRRPLLLKPSAPPETYEQLRSRLVRQFRGQRPHQWGPAIKGVRTRLKVGKPYLALTLDACGGRFDARLIGFLERNRVPATLFVTGRWIDANRATFLRLARNPLFEIENHGQQHRPLSVSGRSIYGIRGTRGAGEAVDEIETNAREIARLTGRRPRYYRPGTGYCDDAALQITSALGYAVVNWSVVGDAGATRPAWGVRRALLQAPGGAIVILHMNHPESGTASGVMAAIPILLKRGVRFIRLQDEHLML